MKTQLKATTRHAIRILKYLDQNQKKPGSQEIAKALNIGNSYLMRIMAVLKYNGFVNTVKGRHGGFFLAISLEEVSLYELVTIMEDELAETDCIDKVDEFETMNELNKVLSSLEKIAKDYLSKVTLKDL